MLAVIGPSMNEKRLSESLQLGAQLLEGVGALPQVEHAPFEGREIGLIRDRLKHQAARSARILTQSALLSAVCLALPPAIGDRRIGLDHADVQVGELLGRHLGRRAHHQVLGALVLRERDHLANAVLVGEQLTTRSIPGAMPPCGGAPYWNARSMWPKFDWIRSGE